MQDIEIDGYQCITCSKQLTETEAVICFTCKYYIQYVKNRSVRRCTLCHEIKQISGDTFCNDCCKLLEEVDTPKFKSSLSF